MEPRQVSASSQRKQAAKAFIPRDSPASLKEHAARERLEAKFDAYMSSEKGQMRHTSLGGLSPARIVLENFEHARRLANQLHDADTHGHNWFFRTALGLIDEMKPFYSVFEQYPWESATTWRMRQMDMEKKKLTELRRSTANGQIQHLSVELLWKICEASASSKTIFALPCVSATLASQLGAVDSRVPLLVNAAFAKLSPLGKRYSQLTNVERARNEKAASEIKKLCAKFMVAEPLQCESQIIREGPSEFIDTLNRSCEHIREFDEKREELNSQFFSLRQLQARIKRGVESACDVARFQGVRTSWRADGLEEDLNSLAEARRNVGFILRQIHYMNSDLRLRVLVPRDDYGTHDGERNVQRFLNFSAHHGWRRARHHHHHDPHHFDAFIEEPSHQEPTN